MNLDQMRSLAIAAGRPNQILIGEEFYSYTAGRPIAAIAPAATQLGNINIQADSDFIIEKTTFSADVAAATQTLNTVTVPNVTVLLVATSSGRQMSNVAVPLSSLFGPAWLPFIWPKPYLLHASSTLSFTLVSFEAAISPFVTLVFHGRKLFWAPARA
jgi:hypothetical protein